MFVPPYEELTALQICQILLKHGASPNGNAIYEMRPLHIAIRRQWTQVSRLLLEAGRLNICLKKIIFVFRS
jgi:ankyrin repeat protein